MPRRANGDAAPYLNEQTGRYELFVELPRLGEKRRRKKVTGRTITECRNKAHDGEQVHRYERCGEHGYVGEVVVVG